LFCLSNHHNLVGRLDKSSLISHPLKGNVAVNVHVADGSFRLATQKKKHDHPEFLSKKIKHLFSLSQNTSPAAHRKNSRKTNLSTGKGKGKHPDKSDKTIGLSQPVPIPVHGLSKNAMGKMSAESRNYEYSLGWKP
jgi:hypothetical protein